MQNKYLQILLFANEYQYIHAYMMKMYMQVCKMYMQVCKNTNTNSSEVILIYAV